MLDGLLYLVFLLFLLLLLLVLFMILLFIFLFLFLLFAGRLSTRQSSIDRPRDRTTSSRPLRMPASGSGMITGKEGG